MFCCPSHVLISVNWFLLSPFFLDNAYDPDVNATQLTIDVEDIGGLKCLTFVDNGAGVSPHTLHKMLSFGFCDKVRNSLWRLKFHFLLQSDPDLPEPRFTGRINFPQYRKLTVFYPDIPGTQIYRAKPFPPSIPVNRGPSVVVLPLESQFKFFQVITPFSRISIR